jgi:hypothetical protein
MHEFSSRLTSTLDTKCKKMYQELAESLIRIRYPVTVIRISDNRRWTSSYISRVSARDCIPNYFP